MSKRKVTLLLAMLLLHGMPMASSPTGDVSATLKITEGAVNFFLAKEWRINYSRTIVSGSTAGFKVNDVGVDFQTGMAVFHFSVGISYSNVFLKNYIIDIPVSTSPLKLVVINANLLADISTIVNQLPNAINLVDIQSLGGTATIASSISSELKKIMATIPLAKIRTGIDAAQEILLSGGEKELGGIPVFASNGRLSGAIEADDLLITATYTLRYDPVSVSASYNATTKILHIESNSAFKINAISAAFSPYDKEEFFDIGDLGSSFDPATKKYSLDEELDGAVYQHVLDECDDGTMVAYACPNFNTTHGSYWGTVWVWVSVGGFSYGPYNQTVHFTF